MKLVMVMKVRNEDDVLEQTLRYHAARGVDAFIVTDNASTDGTPKILRRWERAGRLHWFFEPPTDAFHESAHRWVTRMARFAGSQMKADWVIHADADEFWWPLSGDLKEAFAGIPEHFDVVVGPRSDFVTRPDGPRPFWERMTWRESRSNLQPKLAHRPYPGMVLHGGAHDIAFQRSGSENDAILGRDEIFDRLPERDPRLVYANIFPARVLHLPLRSFAQYRRRVEAMVRGGTEGKARAKLQVAYEQGRLEESYAELVFHDELIGAEARSGRLVFDDRLRDFLGRCPDPISAREANPPAPPPETVEGELADLRFEGMRALTRQQQQLMRQCDRLTRRIRHSERSQADRMYRRFRRRVRAARARLAGVDDARHPQPAAPKHQAK